MKILETSPGTGSRYAGEVDALNQYLVAVSVFFTVAIVAVIIFFTVRYARKSDADRPEPTKDGKLLEILGSVIPFILVMSFFFWGAKLYFDARVPPKNALEILVTGKQWMWKVQHPNGKREINDLTVPVNTPIKLTMISEDVIHSYYLPDFRKKQDVLPGKYTQMWFQPEVVGESHVFCTEYCGTEHSRMIGTLRVVSMEAYQAWLETAGGSGAAPSDPVVAGKEVWELECAAACHTGKRGAIGPNLLGAWGTERLLEGGDSVIFDENYLKESLVEPNKKIAKGYQPAMTAFGDRLSGTQINQLIAYLKSTAQTDAP